MENLTFRDTIRGTTFYQKLGTRISLFKGYLYDRKHGVITAPEVYLSDLSIDNPHASRCGNYSGTEPKHFREILNGLSIDFEKFTFIDFGSGMGRALFLASEKPFKKIIGVEFASELNDIACKNIENFRSPQQQCFDIESICEDAATFELPDEPLVCYLFNPFSRELYKEFLANVERSLAANPRELLMIYASPVENDLFENCEFLEQIERDAWHTLHQAIVK